MKKREHLFEYFEIVRLLWNWQLCHLKVQRYLIVFLFPFTNSIFLVNVLPFYLLYSPFKWSRSRCRFHWYFSKWHFLTFGFAFPAQVFFLLSLVLFWTSFNVQLCILFCYKKTEIRRTKFYHNNIHTGSFTCSNV